MVANISNRKSKLKNLPKSKISLNSCSETTISPKMILIYAHITCMQCPVFLSWVLLVRHAKQTMEQDNFFPFSTIHTLNYTANAEINLSCKWKWSKCVFHHWEIYVLQAEKVSTLLFDRTVGHSSTYHAYRRYIYLIISKPIISLLAPQNKCFLIQYNRLTMFLEGHLILLPCS